MKLKGFCRLFKKKDTDLKKKYFSHMIHLNLDNSELKCLEKGSKYPKIQKTYIFAKRTNK